MSEPRQLPRELIANTALPTTSPERLSLHIAVENDDGSTPTHFLCGHPITVLLPWEGTYAGDDTLTSECATCNRLDAEYGNA